MSAASTPARSAMLRVILEKVILNMINNDVMTNNKMFIRTGFSSIIDLI